MVPWTRVHWNVAMRNQTKLAKTLRAGRAHQKRSEQEVLAALRLAREDNMSVAYASAVCEIPLSTMYRLNRNGPAGKPGPPTILTAGEEQSLVEHVLLMSNVGLGLTKLDVSRKVLRIVDDGRKHPWKEAGQMPGRDWWEGFLRRHPEISMRSNEKLEKARAKMDNPNVLGDFFDKLEAAIREHEVVAANIYNMDETKVEGRPPRTLARRGARSAVALADSPLPHITVVACVNADGSNIMPPLVINKGANILEGWTNPATELPGTTYAATANGWMERSTFDGWFAKFVLHVEGHRGVDANGQPLAVILILDGHDSHISLEAVLVAESKRIVLIQLPAHTSHRTQPLDVGCFASWHRKFGQVLHEHILMHPRVPVTRNLFTALMGPPWRACLSPANITAGFRNAGIVPLDRSKLLKDPETRVAGPSDMVDFRPSTAFTTPSPRTRAVSTPRLTPPEEIRHTPRNALVEIINGHERRIAQLEDAVSREKDLRLQQIMQPPFAREDEQPEKKRGRISSTGHDGKARVLTSGELRKSIDDAKRQQEEKKRAKSAEMAAKRAEKAAARAAGTVTKAAGSAARKK